MSYKCLLRGETSRLTFVGLTGLEPAAFRPPAGRATKLRHSPRHEPQPYPMATRELSWLTT